METTATCPKCNYSTDDKFSICPKCGIIVKKFYETLEARQQLERERLERKNREEQVAELKAAQEEKARHHRQQEEARASEQRRKEEEKKGQMQNWKKNVGGGGAAIVGILFIIAGFLTPPGQGESVTLHSLHIKQTLYSLGGVLLIVSAINTGVEKVLSALADIHTQLKKKE